MFILLQILCIVGGLLAASSLIAKKSEDAGQALAKIAPYQGFIGLGLLGYGIYYLIFFVLPNLTALFGTTVGLVSFALVILMILVGLLLSYNLIASYTMKGNDEAKEKGQAIMAKLVPFQVPLGIALVVLSILTFVL